MRGNEWRKDSIQAGWGDVCGKCVHYEACEYDERIGICDVCFEEDDAPWWTKSGQRALDAPCQGMDFEGTRE